MTIIHVVGARPSFVAMAPVVAALARRRTFDQAVVHVAQHDDARVSADVVADLHFPPIDHCLTAGTGPHGEQTATVLEGFEAILLGYDATAVVVAGDVNATLACALAAAKLGVPIVHVEAGLRSGDWMTPEEINRVLTDRLADVLFTDSAQAADNLMAEGIAVDRVHHVGSTTIDALRRCEKRARARAAHRDIGLTAHEYVLVTLHRPSNVDVPHRLRQIVAALIDLAERAPIVFPVHPHTRARLDHAGGQRLVDAGVHCIDPVGYIESLSLQAHAGAILTDSGGIQDEASALGVDCYTMRPATERLVTLTHGTNVLLGEDPSEIAAVRPSQRAPTPCAVPLWDGQAAERVADVLDGRLAARVRMERGA